jgi:hypothetical protein
LEAKVDALEKQRNIFYIFDFQSGEKLLYPVHIDAKTNVSRDVFTDEDLKSVDWVQLKNNPCSHCPLISDPSQSICPVAKSIYTLVEKFKKATSYEKVTVIVKTKEREYTKTTDLQTGLGSLFGLLMATSRCPHTHFLKPISTMHLPFSTLNETMFRIVSSVFMKKFIDGEETLDRHEIMMKLNHDYKILSIINEAMLSRLQLAGQSEAGKNAIVSLNIFGQVFSMIAESKFNVLKDMLSDFQK